MKSKQTKNPVFFRNIYKCNVADRTRWVSLSSIIFLIRPVYFFHLHSIACYHNVKAKRHDQFKLMRIFFLNPPKQLLADVPLIMYVMQRTTLGFHPNVNKRDKRNITDTFGM